MYIWAARCFLVIRVAHKEQGVGLGCDIGLTLSPLYVRFSPLPFFLSAVCLQIYGKCLSVPYASHQACFCSFCLETHWCTYSGVFGHVHIHIFILLKTVEELREVGEQMSLAIFIPAWSFLGKAGSDTTCVKPTWPLGVLSLWRQQVIRAVTGWAQVKLLGR